MATPIVIIAKIDPELRPRIVVQSALCDMSFLMSALGRERKFAEKNQDAAIGFDAVWQALTGRISELNTAACMACDEKEGARHG